MDLIEIADRLEAVRQSLMRQGIHAYSDDLVSLVHVQRDLIKMARKAEAETAKPQPAPPPPAEPESPCLMTLYRPHGDTFFQGGRGNSWLAIVNNGSGDTFPVKVICPSSDADAKASILVLAHKLPDGGRWIVPSI